MKPARPGPPAAITFHESLTETFHTTDAQTPARTSLWSGTAAAHLAEPQSDLDTLVLLVAAEASLREHRPCVSPLFRRT